MNSKGWSKVKSLFFAASEVDPKDRSQYLAQQTDADTEIRGEVKQMLAGHDEAGSFLNTPALTPTHAPPDQTEILNAEPTQFAVGEIICERYRVKRYIARGGMGEVYEAEDLDLEVVVAIKTLRPAVFAGEALLSRFKREIDLARRVTHPNIGRIFDIGHHRRPDGVDVPFLTMEFLEGETLAQRISRAGPIPEAEALPLIRDMVSALDAIHQNNIVHRDFKSANVMLVAHPNQRLSACVMDFGLARPTASGDKNLTRSGFIAGTPAYMAPEQFEDISTPASDIYAIGVVLHEMLTGARPNARSANPATPAIAATSEWTAIFRRCLASDPAMRFQNAGELLQALPGTAVFRASIGRSKPRFWPWVSLAACTIVLAGIAAFALWRTHSQALSPGATRHLALLPIQSESADPADTAFCAGFSETVRGDLAEMETSTKNALWVIPSSEVKNIKTPSQAYREVGANLVLVANFHRTPNGVSLTVELVDPKNMHLLKSATIEAETLPALRAAAITRIAALLEVPLASAVSVEVASTSSTEPGAFEYYEQGLGYLRAGSLKNVDQSIDLFEKALAKDQEYALAYAGLGEAYASKYEMTKDPRWVKEAVKNGEKAISLNGRLAQVHSTMGVIHRLTGHSDLAVAEARKAIEIEPSCMNCYFQLGVAYGKYGQLDLAEHAFNMVLRNQRGNVLGYGGIAWIAEKRGDRKKAADMYRKALDLAPDRAEWGANLGGIYVEMAEYDKAVPLLQNALRLEPNVDAYSNLGSALMYLGRYQEAAEAMEHAVNLAPDNHDFWRNLGDSYRLVPALRAKANGAYEKALEHARASLAVAPNNSDLLSSMGLYQAHLGNTREALSLTAQALKISPKDSTVLFTAALSANLCGKRKDAVNYLAASAKAGYSLSSIEKEPELANLHDDPAYRRWIESLPGH